jgi:parallel beta-helix repeat protein
MRFMGCTWFGAAVGKRHCYLLIFSLMSALTAWAQCRGNPVTVSPNDDLQALVRACPSGTTFNLTAGVHHDSVTAPKSDDVFTGVAGAIESGAKELTGWSQVTINSVSYWTTAGGKPLSSDSHNAVHCQADYPRCWYVQDLYFDNANYVHVPSLDRVAAGSWYYDFSGDDGGVMNNIYLTDDPTGHVVELGARSFAFTSDSASGITIQNLIIEKYAQNLLDGAVLPRAPGWTIQQCEIRLNHGIGISLRPPNGSNAQILNNVLHDNGEFGFNIGRVSNVIVKGNTIYHNNTDHVNTDFGSGCCKIVGANIMVSDNVVYDNLGMGLWSDAFANGVTYSHNTVYGNTGEGIRVEVSDHNTIANNTVYGNGFGNPDERNRKGPQIHYVSSSHATITDNVVTVSPNSGGGIIVDYNARREGCGQGCKLPIEMTISGNRIIVLTPNIPAVAVADYSNTFNLWEGEVVFDQNIYCLPNASWKGSIWRWGNGNPAPSIDFKTWQSRHQDLHAVFSAGACSSGQ